MKREYMENTPLLYNNDKGAFLMGTVTGEKKKKRKKKRVDECT